MRILKSVLKFVEHNQILSGFGGAAFAAVVGAVVVIVISSGDDGPAPSTTDTPTVTSTPRPTPTSTPTGTLSLAPTIIPTPSPSPDHTSFQFTFDDLSSPDDWDADDCVALDREIVDGDPALSVHVPTGCGVQNPDKANERIITLKPRIQAKIETDGKLTYRIRPATQYENDIDAAAFIKTGVDDPDGCLMGGDTFNNAQDWLTQEFSTCSGYPGSEIQIKLFIRDQSQDLTVYIDDVTGSPN